MKEFFIVIQLFFFSCVLSSCNSANESKISEVSSFAEPDISRYKYVLKFKGNHRCADCPGIETSLTFINDNLTFYEINKYLEKNVVEIDSGSYTTERGFKNDDDATVYVLHDDKPDAERKYLRWNDESLVMIDKQENIPDSSSEYRLYKVQ